MEIKEGADIRGLSRFLSPAMIQIQHIYDDYSEPFIITCGLNGAHSAGSKHYRGEAIDIRTRNFGTSQKTVIYQRIKSALGCGYDVVMEKTHFHIEVK